MSNEKLRIIHKDDIASGGFAGVVETQMVKSPEVWPAAKDNEEISHGLGDFIYLANAYFKPNEGVPLHPHQDVDIVSFITSGKVGHKGSLGDGTVISGPGIQVQRAGTGITHSEFSISDEKAGILQLWFKPPKNGLTPGYRNFEITEDEFKLVLGGNDDETFNSDMSCRIGYLANETKLDLDQPFIAVIFRGTALVNDKTVNSGALIEGKSATLIAQQSLGLVLVTKANSQ